MKFSSIFWKERFGKGSPRFMECLSARFSTGREKEGRSGLFSRSNEMFSMAGAGARGMRFGRSGISSNASKKFGRATTLQIGEAHPHALSPSRWGKQKGRSEQSNCIRCFPFSPAVPKFFGRAARRVPSQSGRTLLEMLAVLAIIGVLSITALVGFTYAMNKHRANETIYDVMLRGTNVPMIDEYYYDKASGYEFRFPDLPAGTYYPMTTKKDAGSSYYVEATGVTYRVCEMILKMNPTDIDQIVVNNSVYTGNSDICGNVDGLAMKFCFGSDGTICDGTGHGGSSGGSGSGGSSGGTSGGSGSGSGSGSGTEPDLCDGMVCQNGGTCSDGTCTCANGFKGTYCEIEPDCQMDADCTSPQACQNYTCVCPDVGTPTICQEVTQDAATGCSVLSHKTDGTECTTDDNQNGVCSAGVCITCSDENSKACCEKAGKLWVENIQACLDEADPCQGGSGTPFCATYQPMAGCLTLSCCQTEIYSHYTTDNPNSGVNTWGCVLEGYYIIPFDPMGVPCRSFSYCQYAACEGPNDVAKMFSVFGPGCCPEACSVVYDSEYSSYACLRDPNDSDSSCLTSDGWYY